MAKFQLNRSLTSSSSFGIVSLTHTLMMSFINSNPICAIYHSSGEVNRDRKSKKIAPYEPITLLLFLICAPMSIWLIFMISVIILRYEKLELRFCSHITSVCIGSFYLQWWFSFKHLNVKKKLAIHHHYFELWTRSRAHTAEASI